MTKRSNWRRGLAVVAVTASVVLVGIAGSSALRQTKGRRLLASYSELSEVLAVKSLAGADVDAFREELLQVEALTRQGSMGEAESLLEALVSRARALEVSDAGASMPATPPPRPFAASDAPAETRVLIDFYSRADEDFRIATTYYVAQNEPGASNQNDGLAPRFEGGTRGPFKDLNDERVRSTLVGASDGVRLVIREGVYVVQAVLERGLLLDGRGDELHPTILSGMPGEDVAIIPGASLGTVEPILVSGRHGIVENLLIKRIGNKYDLLVVGEATIVRHNVFQGPWMEDAIKIGPGARHCLIFNNEITDHGSQAVDSFGNDVLIKENRVHHAAAKGMGFGTKGGTRNHVYIGNVLHDLSRGLGGGGTGDLELYQRGESGELLHAASGVSVLRNTIFNIDGIVTSFYSCKDCTFDSNRVFDSKAGYEVGINSDHFEGRLGHLAQGLPSCDGVTISNNEFANLTSGYVGVVEDHAKRNFVSENNTYFTDSDLIFAYRDGGLKKLDHSRFQETFDTDRDSRFRPLSEFDREAPKRATP